MNTVNKPTISICIPAFNATKYIDETLYSIGLQSYKDWELVVVEDGSVNTVEKHVKRFADSVTQPVKYIKHSENRGLSAARNTASYAAQGMYMAMLDADDYWSEDHLSSVISAIKSSGANVGFSGCWLVDQESGLIKEARAHSPISVSDIPRAIYMRKTIIQPSSVIFERSEFLRIGGSSEAFQCCEDLELWFRAAERGLLFAYSGRETCYYRKHAEAMSTQGAEMTESLARVYALYSKWPSVSASSRHEITSGVMLAAAKMLWRKRPCKAMFWAARAFLVNPAGVTRQLLTGYDRNKV
jgi:teichuronic acid biosynthesis glycosyltransferase TuaG